VTRALAVRILNGTLTPDGHSSTEMDLCRELGVSRTILREAIKVLSAKGLVEVRPKTGVRIKPRSDWSLLDPALLTWRTEVGVDETFVRDLCQVRMMLEPPTAESAAIAATDIEAAEIYNAFLAMETAKSNFAVFVNADYQFHSAISRATHNDFLIQINRIVFDALRGSQSIFRERRDPVGAEAALNLHRSVAEAIRKRKPEAARQAMIQVIRRAEEDVYLAFDKPHKARARHS
jgi:DNA-binding FadR family transcriptional regulator